MKITIIGDIICDKPMLKAAKKTGFKEMFNPLKEYLKDSDYVIANLETSISNKKHTKNTFSFCNPPTLLDTLKENKIFLREFGYVLFTS